MVDSGSCFHLIGREDAPLPEAIEPLPRAKIDLSTANGSTPRKEKAPAQVGPIWETIKSLVLEDAPPVLSTGLLARKRGYKFHWAATRCWLQSSSVRAHKIDLRVERDAPYMCDTDWRGVVANASVGRELKRGVLPSHAKDATGSKGLAMGHDAETPIPSFDAEIRAKDEAIKRLMTKTPIIGATVGDVTAQGRCAVPTG